MFDTSIPKPVKKRSSPNPGGPNVIEPNHVESWEDLQLKGLAVYFAPAGIGKTRSLEVLRSSTGWPTQHQTHLSLIHI